MKTQQLQTYKLETKNTNIYPQILGITLAFLIFITVGVLAFVLVNRETIAPEESEASSIDFEEISIEEEFETRAARAEDTYQNIPGVDYDKYIPEKQITITSSTETELTTTNCGLNDSNGRAFSC